MAAENGRAHANCVNASNPYHECGTACFEKMGRGQGQGQGRKDIQSKKLDYRNGVKEGVISQKKNEERKVNPNCVKASNPYHQCGEHCSKRNGEANALGVNKDSGSWSFGRKKKESDSQPDSPQATRSPRVVDKAAVGGQKADAQRARSEYYPKKKVESENGKSFTSSENFSREIHPEDRPFNKEKIRSTQNDRSQDAPRESLSSLTGASASMNGKDDKVQKNDRSKDPPKANVTSLTGASASMNGKNDKVQKNDRSKDPPKANVTSLTGASPSMNGKDDKIQASHHEIYHSTEDIEEYIPGPTDQSMNFSFSGIDQITPRDSDDEEARSVVSDCVSVGKYHVRASISSILQSIINKYGDIAANCNLGSNSMRSYYLECLCSVVQELQSTSLMQMTKAKVKEMLAVLKDVESAQIDVSWLQNILNEISEAIELSTQHQTIDAAKATCDNLLKSTRKELESQMQELALKEKEVSNLKERVAETKSRLSNLEFESNQLEQTIQATQSNVNKFSRKPVADEIL